nr:peptidylprolyl isomerase [Methylocaldum szegediense]
MRLGTILFVCLFGISLSSVAAEKPNMNEPAPQVKLETNLGDIILKLDSTKAPVTVENFLTYVCEGHYDGTIFHRVIPNFMAQGGGYTEDFKRKPTHKAIKNEADNGLKNKRGTIAMARTSDPHSATSQFFINFVDNAFLDYKSSTPQGWGYAVFGEVTEGMDVVDKMATIPTGPGGPMASDVPTTPIILEKATVIYQ